MKLFSRSSKKWRTGSPLGWSYTILHFFYFNALRLSAISLFFFAVVYANYLSQLKEITPLSEYQPTAVTKIYSEGGVEVARLAHENRRYVAYDDIPEDLVAAFISAEDKRFFEHRGVDPLSVSRAVLQNVSASDGQMIGASTITQQLAKVIHSGVNSKRDLDAKIKEALLALDIERRLSKQQIIELYLNEIPLGLGTFGVSSAALKYFGKDLSELSLSETAFLASLPKSPTNYNPERYNAKATERRDWVIGRMLANGHISKVDAWSALKEPLAADIFGRSKKTRGNYFTDQVRRELLNHFDEEMVFGDGLSVKTTMDPKVQNIATTALRNGLEAYDRRHGWRGSFGKINIRKSSWQRELENVKRPKGTGDWQVAVVTKATNNALMVSVQGGATGLIPSDNLAWTRPKHATKNTDPKSVRASSIARAGDLILVSFDELSNSGRNLYNLKQVPTVNGAVVAMNPRNGHILALQGGYDFELSQYNRVSQAKRQPASTFKPFVYLAALNEGYSASSIIKDEPIEIALPSGAVWKPKNHRGGHWGKVRFDQALQLSRNLPTIWLARDVGMDKISDYAGQFGISYDMPNSLANSIGSWETSLLSMTGAYAMLANEGELVIPTTINLIKDRNRDTIFESETGLCSACLPTSNLLQKTARSIERNHPLYTKSDVKQLRSILQGVFREGTASGLAAGLPSDIAGKTGTSNNNTDAWFIGFTDDLVVGVYVGFDTPKSLGKHEYGATVAGPIFKETFVKILNELEGFGIENEDIDQDGELQIASAY